MVELGIHLPHKLCAWKKEACKRSVRGVASPWMVDAVRMQKYFAVHLVGFKVYCKLMHRQTK